MVKFKIKKPEDVAKFFFWLVFEKDINIHPDDPLNQCVNLETKDLTFTGISGLYYESKRQECLEVCEKYGVDIYQIATRVLNLFYFCIKDKIMEKLTRSYDDEEE